MKYDLKESTSTLIKKASRLYIRLANVYLKEVGIPHAYSSFLLQLWHEDGQTQAALHKKIGIEQPTAVRTLDRMEKDNYIRRENSKEDRRITKIFLTKKSWDLHAESLVSLRTLNDTVLEGFTATNRKLLNKLLRDAIANMENKLK